MSAQEIDEGIRRETVSQCYTSFTRQGGNVYPESETEQALRAEIAALKAQLAAAIYALECVVPINGRGECFYCGVGSKPNAKGYHVDRENLWDGDQLCYNSDYYDDVRAVLKGAK